MLDERYEIITMKSSSRARSKEMKIYHDHFAQTRR